MVEKEEERNRDRAEKRGGEKKGEREREREKTGHGKQFTAFHWTAVSNGHNAGPAFFT